MSRVAAFITPGASLEQAIERVRIAESLGYESVFTTHIAGRDALMTLAAYAQATSTIKLGTGVVPCFPRHPVSLAMEAATLDEISGGRLILGVGPSHKITMENWYGLPMDKPLTQMREYVDILRQIFTRDGASFGGEFYKGSFAFLGYGARKDLPIYVSALAPKMLRWAGEITDGVILWGCMPSYIREVVAPTVREGAIAAGRSPDDVEIVAAIPTAVTTDPESARARLRTDFFPYMTLPYYRRVIAGAGFGDEIAAFDAAQTSGDWPGSLAAISDRMLAAFAAIGDADAVRTKFNEYRDAGVTLAAVGLFDAGDGFAGYEETLKAAIG